MGRGSPLISGPAMRTVSLVCAGMCGYRDSLILCSHEIIILIREREKERERERSLTLDTTGELLKEGEARLAPAVEAAA